jgi:cytochrome c553
MTTNRLIVLLLGCLAANALAAETGGAPGKTVEDIVKPCAACHGADGNATASQYPRLAGQYHDYLARAMKEYQTGERQNAIMAGFVKTLSDAEIEAIARYYAAMPGKLDDLARYESGN